MVQEIPGAVHVEDRIDDDITGALMCYVATQPLSQNTAVHTNNELGENFVYLWAREELCVPALLP